MSERLDVDERRNRCGSHVRISGISHRIDTRLNAAATYYDRDHSVLTGANQNAAGGSLGAGVTLHLHRGGVVALDASVGGLGQDTRSFGLSWRYSLDF